MIIIHHSCCAGSMWKGNKTEVVLQYLPPTTPLFACFSSPSAQLPHRYSLFGTPTFSLSPSITWSSYGGRQKPFSPKPLRLSYWKACQRYIIMCNLAFVNTQTLLAAVPLLITWICFSGRWILQEKSECLYPLGQCCAESWKELLMPASYCFSLSHTSTNCQRYL